MTSKAKDSYGSEAVEPGAETQEQDRLLDSTRGDKIRHRAYEIYLERGSEPGRELEDWLQAERELTTDADQSSNRPLTSKPGTIGAAAPTDFGHDHQIIGIRMQRLLNDLIGDMRTVEIAGVDVVHARRDSLAQNRDRTGNIARRAPNKLVSILSGELHRPITEPVYSQRGAGERKAATENCFVCHFVKVSPTSSSLFFQSASALSGSSA